MNAEQQIIEILACLRVPAEMRAPQRERILQTDGIAALCSALNDADLAAARKEAQRNLLQWQANGYSIVPIVAAEYPKLLLDLLKPPPLLFIEGKAFPDGPIVSIVGAKNPSPLDIQAAKDITKLLAQDGIPIVSGFTTDTDLAVHRATLDAKGHPIAIMPSGLDDWSPKKNAGLRRRIQRNGTICSRFYPDQEKTEHTYGMPEIVAAGISNTTIIINCDEYSSVRVQARAAREHSRGLILTPGVARNTTWGRLLAQHNLVSIAENPRHAAELAQTLCKQTPR